jgi:hypothetical protein
MPVSIELHNTGDPSVGAEIQVLSDKILNQVFASQGTL